MEVSIFSISNSMTTIRLSLFSPNMTRMEVLVDALAMSNPNRSETMSATTDLANGHIKWGKEPESKGTTRQS